ncbi:unnamed protein product, partial [Iphiclides podalirius]
MPPAFPECRPGKTMTEAGTASRNSGSFRCARRKIHSGIPRAATGPLRHSIYLSRGKRWDARRLLGHRGVSALMIYGGIRGPIARAPADARRSDPVGMRRGLRTIHTQRPLSRTSHPIDRYE